MTSRVICTENSSLLLHESLKRDGGSMTTDIRQRQSAGLKAFIILSAVLSVVLREC